MHYHHTQYYKTKSSFLWKIHIRSGLCIDVWKRSFV